MGFELQFSDKDITAWGGMGLMKRMLNRIGFDSALEVGDLPQPSSDRGYSPTQLVVQFMLSVWRGAARGVNPRKPGRHSHHYLMVFIADARMIANLWLRPGSSHSANNALAFLDGTLDKLGGKQVALLRADSGFWMKASR